MVAGPVEARALVAATQGLRRHTPSGDEAAWSEAARRMGLENRPGGGMSRSRDGLPSRG